MRIEHRHALLEHVAHALPAIQARLLRKALRVPMLAPGCHRRRTVGLGKSVGMGEFEADVAHALDHRRRRCGAGHHAAHACTNALPQGRVRVDQHVVHDGSCAVVIHAVHAHGVEHGADLHLAQAHVGAGEHGHRPWEAPAVAVKQRQGPQVLREVRHAPGQGVAHCVQIGTTVVGHHALGVPGGPGRVGHGDGVPLILRAGQLRHRSVLPQQRFVIMLSQALARPAVLTVTDIDDDRCPAVLGAQNAQRLFHHARQLAIGDQHRRFAMLHLPGK